MLQLCTFQRLAHAQARGAGSDVLRQPSKHTSIAYLHDVRWSPQRHHARARGLGALRVAPTLSKADVAALPHFLEGRAPAPREAAVHTLAQRST